VLFEQTRRQLREAGRDREEEVVLEIMDFLVGWCSPHMNLEPKKTPVIGMLPDFFGV